MYKYRLEDTEKRKEVDLRSYEALIEKIVEEVHPGAKVKVVSDGYYLPNYITRGEKIKIA